MANNKSLHKKSSKVKSNNVNNSGEHNINLEQKTVQTNSNYYNHDKNDVKQTTSQTQNVNSQSNSNDSNKQSHSEKQSVNSNHVKTQVNENTTSKQSVDKTIDNENNKVDSSQSNSDQVKTQDPVDYQKLYEHSQYEIEKLKILYANNQNECTKLKTMLDTERQHLIEKLEEKSKVAQLQIEEKLVQLESAKQEEVIKIKESIATDIIIAFIEPILLFESSIQNAPKDNPTIIAYLQGYTMIVNMFKEKLDGLGVQQIDVHVGDQFNEKFMSAFDVEQKSGVEPNRVIQIVSKGFVLNKKIIKYVSVVVSK